MSDLVLLFIPAPIGFVLSLLFVGRFWRSFLWAVAIWMVYLAFESRDGSARDFDFALGFAVFTLPFMAVGIATGVLIGRLILHSLDQGAKATVPWAWQDTTISLLIVAMVGMTVWGRQEYEAEKLKAEQEEIKLAEEVYRKISNQTQNGIIAEEPIRFPMNPKLKIRFTSCLRVMKGCEWRSVYLSHDRGAISGRNGTIPIRTSRNPIPIIEVQISPTAQICEEFFDCVEKNRLIEWCSDIQPIFSGSIWCDDGPKSPINFFSETDNPNIWALYLDLPEYSEVYRNTPIGSASVKCQKHHSEWHKYPCSLVFSLKGGVGVELRFTREQIMSQDPIIAQSIALVPEYWKALTQSASAP